MTDQKIYETSAYGGENWIPRSATHKDEIGDLWASCGINSEWNTLRRVLLHPPGKELTQQSEPDIVQMFDQIDLDLAQEQFNGIIEAYKAEGILIDYVNPTNLPSPNQIFSADLFFMTPEGAIIGRPASRIRAGEEIWVSRRLADLGIPIIKTIRGRGIFEGADGSWLNPNHVLLGRGLRTNDEAITQITLILNEMSIEVTPIDLPIGTMHLMGILRFIDRNLVLVWPFRLAWKAVEKLRDTGYKVLFIPDEKESTIGGALNFVTLGPKKILMAEGNPITQSFLENHGVMCKTVRVNELLKAAGGIGCLTGVIEREMYSDDITKD